MGYTEEDWQARIAQRSDITTGLVHLTRATDKLPAVEVLLNILNEGRLIGSSTDSGFIVGKRKAVCFQEAPAYSVTENLYTEQNFRKNNPDAKVRYQPCGLQFGKRFVFGQGGRPVIYDRTSVAKNYLPETEWWRIVNYDLSDSNAIIDWTHEREWRVPDDLKFTLSDVTVLVGSGSTYQKFVSMCIDNNQQKILTSIKGIVQLGAVFF